MASEIKISNAGVNAAADAFAVLLNSGYLRIYAGSKPATADTAISGQTLLAELRFGSTAFVASALGVIVANAVTRDEDANATGTAAFYRAFKSDGTSPIVDGTVGTSSADMIVETTSITAGQPVECSAFQFSFPKA